MKTKIGCAEALKLLLEGREVKSQNHHYVLDDNKNLTYMFKKGEEFLPSSLRVDSFIKLAFELVPEKDYTFSEALAFAFEGWELEACSTLASMRVENGKLVGMSGGTFMTTLSALESKWRKVKHVGGTE